MLSLQQTRPRQSISQAQSLAVIQTLLRAGLGCITFLRNLLPDDNFSESHFTTSDDTTPSSSQISTSSAGNHNSNQRISGFKIMTMARGYSEEADRILDYLEYGIFDALEKQYLRSFIFAIYLDNKDPNNIVEAYTFNFRYHKLPGCDAVVPIMTLGDDLRSPPTMQEDPVTEAAKRGKVPTLRDVKKSVKTLLKTLIHAMSQMDVLPKRRYATFKIFYAEDTPVDYEPPYFQPGDADKDRWYLMTHNLEEVPDKWSIGKIDTGHHSVHLNITSIATYLPSTEPEEATFSGTIDSTLVRPNLTPMQEAAIRAQQADQQEKDAEIRNLVWSADADVCDEERDADGEDDPDYIRQPDGSLERIRDSHILVPVGLRNESGSIEAIKNSSELEPAAIYGGPLESIPLQLKDLPEQAIDPDTQYDETQTFDFEPPHSPLPPSDPTLSLTPSPISNTKSIIVDTNNSLADDVGMGLLVEKMTLEDNATEPGQQEDPQTPTRPIEYSQNTETVNDIPQHIDKGIACECDIPTEDECCFCEGGCSRWYHIWCMGYHSVDDKRIPAKFICFDCRLRSDVSWQLIKSDLYPRLMIKHRDLALFRRAIKTAEMMKSMAPLNFAKRLGTSFVQSRQLLKRLEEEGFIQEHVAVTDNLGITKTRPKKQGNAKQKQRRNNMQKSQYHFNKAILKSLMYRDYFDPSLKTENKLLGISEMTAKYNMRLATAKLKPLAIAAGDSNGSQTQDAQMVVDNAVPTTVLGAKRTSGNDEDNPPKKKMKISVTTGVDLAE